MSRRRVLVDTAVFLYALGGEHPLREACRAVIATAPSKDINLYASVEMVQELVFHRMRVGNRQLAVSQGRDASRVCSILDFDRHVLERSLALIEEVPTIRDRDAVHAATALLHGITTILSLDTAFDGIPGLTRVDPISLAGH